VWSGAPADVRAVTVVEGPAGAMEDTELTTRARRWPQP
jgi:hypothetical protein